LRAAILLCAPPKFERDLELPGAEPREDAR
jgi:hypothetical protein